MCIYDLIILLYIPPKVVLPFGAVLAFGYVLLPVLIPLQQIHLYKTLRMNVLIF